MGQKGQKVNMYCEATTTLDIFGNFPQLPRDTFFSINRVLDAKVWKRYPYINPQDVYDTMAIPEAISASDKPTWLIKTRLSLQKFSELPEDWDGYGSPPLLDILRKNALSFLESIKFEDVPALFVAPISGGAVQFEWHYEGRELEVEFLEDNVIGFLKIHENNSLEEGEFAPNDTSTARDIIRWLTSRS